MNVSSFTVGRVVLGQREHGAAGHRALLARLLNIIIVLAMAAPCVVLSQEARLVNAQTQTRAVTSGLEKEFRSLVKNQVEPAWIGYAVPVVEGNHHICCYSSEESRKPASLRRGRCQLESRDEGMNFNSLTVQWLTDVKPKESIDLLASFVGENEASTKAGRKQSESALAAIALHADPAADAALEKFVELKHPEDVRKNTAFWLGNLRGQKGYEILRRMVREDPSDKVREHCTFALHISKVPEAVNAMIDAARNDKSAHVRGQALFWLSQKAGDKAARAISDAIENDPETDVKKKAVFALSQLPKDQGVPKLIHAARDNRNREVRKDAMFWLGQSNDPRALTFFEEVLTH